MSNTMSYAHSGSFHDSQINFSSILRFMAKLYNQQGYPSYCFFVSAGQDKRNVQLLHKTFVLLQSFNKSLKIIDFAVLSFAMIIYVVATLIK